MKLPGSLVVLMAVIQAGLPGRATSVEAVIPPEVRLLTEAKTFRVEVEQSYGPAGEKKLAFNAVAVELLTGSGLVAATGDAADLKVRIHAEGTPQSQKYRDMGSGEMVEHFAGAKLAGWIELVARTGPPVRVTFSGERAPPLTIHEAFAEPGDAPFAAVFGGFVDRMTTLVSHARGPGAAEKIFAKRDLGPLEYDAPRLQFSVAQVLGEMKPPGVMEKLLAGFETYSPPQRRAAAARGLLVLHDAAAIPALVAQLDDEEYELEKMEKDGRWAALISMEMAFTNEEDGGGFLQSPRPEIMETLRQLDSPGKIALLTTALQDGSSVLRRVGAALLLGQTKQPRVVATLIAALQGDTHSLVQAAAANALAFVGDKRAALPLLKRALQADDDEAKYAALRALETIAPEMVPREKPAEPAPPENPAEETPPKTR